MTTSSISNTPDHQSLVSTADQLQQLIESFIELGVLVHDNQGTPQTHQVLTHKFTQLISQLSELTNQPQISQYPIPIDIINYIEDGRNPDIYTREFVEVNAKSNARLKAKMENFAKLRDVLSEKLQVEYPDLKEPIADIKRRTSA